MNLKNLMLNKLELLMSKQRKLWPQIDELQDIIGLDVEEYKHLVKMQNEYIKLDYQIEILFEILNENDKTLSK